MIETALHYASAGYRVFPLVPGDKGPVVAGGRGCLDATRDRGQIETWWREYPDANVGIATGYGLLVVDVDPRKTERYLESLHELALPQTFTVRTWSGGWHLYFSMPSVPYITIGTNLLPGIDWRGHRGYVVAPGSVVNGALYTIARDLPIARAPTSLLERISRRGTLARPVKDSAGHMVIPDGQRNETLFALACLLRRFGLEFNAIYESLKAANADHCDPAVSDEELRKITDSALRYGPHASQSPQGPA